MVRSVPIKPEVIIQNDELRLVTLDENNAYKSIADPISVPKE